jgi:hypothetical protein
MWYTPEKYNRIIPNLNDEYSRLKDTLEDKEAKITLAKFLRSNIGITTELISGIKLWPYQEVVIKAMLNRNFCLNVWGRGASKSFSAAVFCFLQCIFEPKSKILIAGPTFRTARSIFNSIEKITESKGADLLMQAFGAKSKRNDEYDWSINEGSIKAIPLSGEKIRGFRANVLVLDEFMLLPEDIIKNVLMPFLIVPQDIKERISIREQEDDLISQGAMTEADRMEFKNTSKMIALSSASYTFENLYKTYKEWCDNIYSKEPTSATYFVSQLSYEALPLEMIDSSITEEAQNGGASHASFLREYCAQFTDGSDSYFSMKKMEECTLKFEERPHSQIKGDSGKQYILAMDPNMSDSPNADYFAMGILEIDRENKNDTLVHCYAGLGSLNTHIKYFHYLMTSFNIVYIICDNAGADIFFNTYNESQYVNSESEKIKFIDFDSDLEGIEYTRMVQKAKSQYNLENKQIAVTQVFTTTFIRRGNENLQAAIDYKKIWFASKTVANENFFNEEINKRIPEEIIFVEENKDWNKLDLIEHQDLLVYNTKKQCSLVEFTTSSRGSVNFDLPQHLKRSNSPNRARKDNYTALMLAKWGSKCYNDIMTTENKIVAAGFTPILI